MASFFEYLIVVQIQKKLISVMFCQKSKYIITHFFGDFFKMFITEPEFNSLNKKYDIQWRPIEDSQISPNKQYIISDKQFEHDGKKINVLEKKNGKYRRVATRLARKENSYLNFDVASTCKQRNQKTILLHRARLIAFLGQDPSKPIARHGSLGQHNHDLENLSWGTHDDNMDDAKRHGVHKGENNGSAKITKEQALVIYVLSQLDLITPKIISELPIGKVSVNAIKAKKKWGHIVTDDIEQIVNWGKEVLSTRLANELSNQERMLEQKHSKEIAKKKKDIRLKVKTFSTKIWE